MSILFTSILLSSWDLFFTILAALVDNVRTCCKQKLYTWWLAESPGDLARKRIATAESFEEWEAGAIALDEVLGNDVWRESYPSLHYDHRVIKRRLQSLIRAKSNNDIWVIVHLIRSGLVRNLVNITSPQLYDCAYSGTKVLIEEYISEVGHAIEYIAALETVPRDPKAFDSQDKLRLLYDTRQAFGRSALILQGGAVYGTCHLGVVKALFLRGLLPRIITGTATGALVAALVAVHKDDDLIPVLNGEGIDEAVSDRLSKQKNIKGWNILSLLARDNGYGRLPSLIRRTEEYIRESYFPDLKLLEEYVKSTVGEMTFEEAFAKTKRCLNITIPTAGRAGTPNLLNYLTAPNVLIWSAAAASNVSSATSSRVTLYCKDETGAIVPWPDTKGLLFRSWRELGYNERECPVSRLSELFNVNHFIIAQARPFRVPIYLPEVERPGKVVSRRGVLLEQTCRVINLEIRHRLRQLDSLGLLPTPLRRLLIYEDIEGPHMTILPELGWMDLSKVFKPPPRAGEEIRRWILKGERGTWPAIAAVRVRCTVEFALEKGYQVVKPQSKPGFVVGDE
ncbi:triacylglycerol lipase [Histoplasma capsulatum var. duboisii H88]|uniref:Triacylglycerol lipase n=2 Tax=Ajellomyces capsulatus TaxID=5037 RepID=F0USA7_AJEC8|nr:triacylglycerol lipase [Histoplasma capsulatum H143]EGC48784.1 triacylglycerol lipase [Histoplasma capsulatum var. duboisii H88]QSS54385.1 triacylglycerol lipase [Histoplasma capsulatum var. duboisii H88]